MDRRSFVIAAGAALGRGPLGHRFGNASRETPVARLTRIGLELYSVRDQMRKDPEGTMAAVRAIGYDDVEILWTHKNYGRTPQQVRATLDQLGLKAPSAHIDPELLTGDWDKALADAHVFGHQYLIVPSLPDETKSLDVWRKWADIFNTAGAAARKANIWLAFHNEPEHSKPIAGAIPYDLFLERTDASVVRLQLDIGNMVMGGGDPAAYLAKHAARYWSFHAKDIVADRTGDTELGAGTVGLAALLKLVPRIDAKPVYIEQEGARDPLESARLNYQYLRNLDF